ncbi:RNA polymerase sigma factor [Flavobacterium hiemivividum]|uniref:RNA polymerase sigma-70 factor n=1 Tax=Flavobacterium hiemivividum TaxID=2541734 RepID=A0A4R5CYN1_9FLAO|nr:RNA polymerase sigma-70 factor [Flavobacterium hiemivividum]TDE04640.1 RNA polymerase sigma-70 factor [Flavobacterium hiemivividum]
MNSADFNNNDFLIERLSKGDEKAYEYLMNTYHHKLCVYANSLIRNIYTAEDIVQNVFVKVWEQRTRLKQSHSIQSFLYKLVYNEFIDQYRKNQSLFTLEKTYFEALNTAAQENNAEDMERIVTVLNKEINNLPPKCKEVFILSKQEGLTNVEIAEHLDVSIKTVEAQITKAFSLLRLTLQEKVKTILFYLFGKGMSIFKRKKK